MTQFERRYRRIARSLSNAELTAGSMDACFTAEELVGRGAAGSGRFLDFYGEEGIRLALERYGLIDAFARRGYPNVDSETSTSDERHTLFLHAEVAGRRERLVELVARRDRLVPHAELPGLGSPHPWDVLTVEWLTLRHPLGRYTAERPRLPGQDAPGLGMGAQVLELLYRAVERLRLDGLVAAAAYFHLAVLYGLELRFFDPWYGGQLLALEQLVLRERLTLAQASWAVEWGFVRDPAGHVLAWRGQAQVWPRAEELTRWFVSEDYGTACAEAAASQPYTLDADAFRARWAAEAPELTGG